MTGVIRKSVALAAVALAATATGTGIAAADTAYHFCTPDTVQPDGMCHFDATNVVFPSDITAKIPAKYADQVAVENYLSTVVNEYEANARAVQPAPDASSFTATGTLYSSQKPATQSEVLLITQNISGTAHPTTSYKTFTVGGASHQPITLDQLFRPGTRPAEVLYPLVTKQLQSPAKLGADFSIPDDVGLDPATYQNFAVTDDAVLFFFGEGDLGFPGTADVTFTKQSLAPHLNSDFG